jgi:hypothetical protein
MWNKATSLTQIVREVITELQANAAPASGASLPVSTQPARLPLVQGMHQTLLKPRVFSPHIFPPRRRVICFSIIRRPDAISIQSESCRTGACFCVIVVLNIDHAPSINGIGASAIRRKTSSVRTNDAVHCDAINATVLAVTVTGTTVFE